MQILKVLGFILISSLLFMTSSLAQDEKFDLFIVPTLDDQLDSWVKLPPNLKPTIHLVPVIYPNQPFALRLLFRNYSLSPLKNAHITYDVQFFGPDKKPTEDSAKNLLGYNGPVKSADYIIINQQLLRVFFDEDYAPGDYEIQITATDQMSKTVISKSGDISFAPFERVGNFATFDFFKFWIKSHFRQPDIAKATFGVLQFLKNEPQWLKENISLLAFINQLLNDNQWVWDHLAKVYRTSDADKNSIITLMALNNHLMPEFTQNFNDEQKTWFETVRSLELLSKDTEITTTKQIEELWGIFYATGHLKPVEQVVRLLKPFTLSTQPTEGTLPEEPEQAAFWSLINNARDLPLVVNYCIYLKDHGKLTPENMIQLRLALDVIKKSLEEGQSEPQTPDKKMPLPQTR